MEAYEYSQPPYIFGDGATWEPTIPFETEDFVIDATISCEMGEDDFFAGYPMPTSSQFFPVFDGYMPPSPHAEPVGLARPEERSNIDTEVNESDESEESDSSDESEASDESDDLSESEPAPTNSSDHVDLGDVPEMHELHESDVDDVSEPEKTPTEQPHFDAADQKVSEDEEQLEFVSLESSVDESAPITYESSFVEEIFDTEMLVDDIGDEFNSIGRSEQFYYIPDPIPAPCMKRAREPETEPVAGKRTCLTPELRTQPLEEFVDKTNWPYGRGFTEFVQEWANRFDISFNQMRARITNVLQQRPIFRSIVSKEKAAFMSITRYFNVNNFDRMHFVDSLFNFNNKFQDVFPTTDLTEITIEIDRSHYGCCFKTVPVLQYLQWLAAFHAESPTSDPSSGQHPVLKAFRGKEFEMPGKHDTILDVSDFMPLSSAELNMLGVQIMENEVAHGFVARGTAFIQSFLTFTNSIVDERVRPKISILAIDHMIILVGHELEILKFQLILFARANQHMKNPTVMNDRKILSELALDVAGVGAAVCEWCLQQARPTEEVMTLFLVAFWTAFSEHVSSRSPVLQKSVHSISAAFEILSGCQDLRVARDLLPSIFITQRNRNPRKSKDSGWGISPAQVHAFGATAVSGCCRLNRMQYMLGLNSSICHSETCKCRAHATATLKLDSAGEVELVPEFPMNGFILFCKPRQSKIVQ